jgi:hypothetical protein
MNPSRRVDAAATRPHGAARAGAAFALLVAGPVFLLTTGATAIAAAPSVSAASVRADQSAQPAVKFYIVPPPADGKTEFLYEIAAKTLRNGKRFPEIFALNKGRLQPDGGHLENPNVIKSGWILQLPEDASGPGVQVGPLPTVQSPGTGDGGGVVLGPSAAPGERGNAPSFKVGGGRLLLISGAIFTLLIGAGLVFVLFVRKPRASRRARRRAARAPKEPKKSTKKPNKKSGEKPGEKPKEPQAREPAQALAPALPAASAPRQPAPAAPAGPAQPAVADPALAMVGHVSFGDDSVQVRIATAATDAAAVVWTPMPFDVPEGGVAYVCLGESDKGCLFVDLGRAPGPISVGGDPAAAARLVELIAFQVSARLEPNLRSVTVVGDVGRDMDPRQVDRVDTLERIASRGSPGSPGAGPLLEVVICSSDRADAAALAPLSSDPSRRIVPLVLGGLPNAMWSLTAGHQRPDAPIQRNHDEAAGLG